MKDTYIHIFTRDFRIIDNLAINYLSGLKNIEVIPIFLFLDKQVSANKNQYYSENCVQLMVSGLQNLNKTLDFKLNCYNKMNYEQLLEHLSSLSEIRKIKGITINLDYTPFGISRNKSIHNWCGKHGVLFKEFPDYNAVDINLIKTQKGTIYKRFFHYYNSYLLQLNSIKPISRLKNKIDWISINDDLEKINQDTYNLSKYNKDNKFLPFTRAEALRKISINKLLKYKDFKKLRKFPRYDTTLLSAYLKFGLISIRELIYKVILTLGKDSELLRQIIWREFYYYLMYHLPLDETIGGSNMQGKIIKWENNPVYFKAWCDGKTGFPLVDASIRQMNMTGWMHNQARLVSANALVYLFAIDWKKGEKYFAQTLADYDISQNNGNWQWCGGVGVDTKPYLRMYNYSKKINDLDQDCVYIKKWVKELRNVPNEIIKKWETLPTTEQSKFDYIIPIVDYKERRKIASEIF